MTTSATPAFDLYGFWRTSATYRVRVALAMKRLPVHEHIVNLDAGEQHSPAYRALNPLGGIPTLVEPGHAPITQSLAILEFLEETQPEPPLLPSERHARARVRSLAGMLAADTHPLITPRVRKYLNASHDLDDAAWRAWQTHWFGTGLRAVEQRLASEAETGVFCHGDQPGMADICLASVLAVMQVFQIEVRDIPTIERIVARCQTLAPFARAHPRRQPGAPAA
ncbi:MAG: maleylacetoacetate isomerase [Pseudomonadota bacterium]|jgi:maleylacetoacetate isomerase|nr:maleylacetoacetate isomerase [Pseudomonadota bacterium]